MIVTPVKWIEDAVPDTAHSLALISAVDPALLGLIDLALSGEDAVVIRASLLPQEGPEGIVRLVSTGGLDQEPVSLDLPMPTHCHTCSLREVLVAVAQDRAIQDPGGTTVVLLPPAIELVHLVPRLAQELEEVGRAEGLDLRLAGVAHALEASTAQDELLEHHLLSERGLEAHPEDARCTGEVHMVNLGYADLILSLGQDEAGAGADLIEHLRPHSTLLLPGMDAPLLECLLAITHDAGAAIGRVHPATTQAWGGPDEHGVWTLDLFATLPFHPGRLRELVADLAGHGLCARGCFWLPSRPGRVCAWEVAGGALSVGDAGSWAEVPDLPGPGEAQTGALAGVGLDGAAASGAAPAPVPGGAPDGAAPGEPRCHLVVTGVGDPQVREQVRRAFDRVLLRSEEMSHALAWIGVDDGLGDWFGGQD
ncbi:GTP-binding protein [Actinomyces bowdenii]|uniref:GTP-binding protein n=1 Tax=Actinomyces bowdenii TaxID=131109 RepID=UPI00214AC300|nr:GTP-binding protein [Actinomyces bowdenii]MCR2053728.1 GTP-binding protein [Actinomyces bowdenii]